MTNRKGTRLCDHCRKMFPKDEIVYRNGKKGILCKSCRDKRDEELINAYERRHKAISSYIKKVDMR